MVRSDRSCSRLHLKQANLLLALSLISAMLMPAFGLLGFGPSTAGASMDPSVIGDIYSVVGTGSSSVLAGNGIQAAMASIKGPSGSAVDAAGNLYFADASANMVLELAASTHSQWGISMVAGDLYRIIGQANGVAGDGVGAAAMASTPLDAPSSVALDSLGDLYIANTAANDVMEVSVANQSQWGTSMLANHAYIVAGVHGSSGSTGQLLRAPQGVAVDSSGNLYIADSGNARVAEKPVKSTTAWGKSLTANAIVTIAGVVGSPAGSPGDGGPATSGSLSTPSSVAFDVNGNLYVTDDAKVQEIPSTTGTQWGQAMTANDVYTVAGSPSGAPGNAGIGGPANAALLSGPDGLAFTSSGDLVIADSGNNQIKILASSTKSQFGQAMTQNDLYGLSGDPGATAGFSGDGGAATSATLFNPDGVAIDATGNLFVSDAGNHRVREITATSVPTLRGLPGNIYAIAGIGATGLNGTATEATDLAANHVHDGSFDANGDYYYADTLNNRVQELAATTHSQWGIAMTAGNSYTIAGSPTGGSGLSGSGVDGAASLLNQPRGIWVDAAGDVYIADGSNNRVEELASSTGTQWGQAMTANHLFGVAGTWIGSSGHGGDGGPATSASLDNPYGVTLDGSGNLYIALNGSNEVREVAATSGTQWGQSMTANCIYRIMGSSSGVSGSSADGVTASSSKLWGADSVAVDQGGNLFVASASDDQIDELVSTTGTQWGRAMTANHVYSVAGTQLSAGFGGDQGPASSALLSGPVGIGLDANGDLYIADTGNNRVREVAATTGSQWGQAMTAGNIYTVAGTGAGSGTLGLGGPAKSAAIQSPTGVRTDGQGDLFIDNRAVVDEVISYNAVIAAGGPTNPGETSGGTNLSELNSTQPSVPTGDSSGTGMAVDVATGELSVNVTDTSISGLGTGLVLTRTYSSTGSSAQGSLGFGWTQAYGMSISADPVLGSSVEDVTQENGSVLQFIKNAQGFYVAPSRAQASLSFDSTSNSWAFTRAGRQIFRFDGTSGDLQSIADLNAETTTVSESSGEISSVTSSTDRSLSFTWTNDSPPLLSSVTDPAGRTVHYGYDDARELTSVVDVAGNTTSYVYDAAHRLISVTNALGGVTSAVYDNAGRIMSETDPMGRTTSWSVQLDSSGSGSVSSTDPLGALTLRMVTKGEVTSTTRAVGTPSESTTTASLFPGAGGTRVVTTAAGTPQAETTSSTYGLNGNLVENVDPLGRTTTATFNSFNEPLTRTSALGEVTTFTYDARGNETSMSRPIPGGGSQTTQFAYGDPTHPGEVTAATDPKGNTWHYGYDGDGHRISITDALGHQTTSTWNSLGERTSATDANGKTTSYVYDRLGNLIKTTDPTGAVTSATFDALGDRSSETDAASNTTSFQFDADHELTATTLPDSSTTHSTYDGNGHEITATDANGAVTTSTYTPSGRLASSTDPTGATTSYSNDPNGNRVTMTDPSSNTTTMAYDADNELISTTVNGALAEAISYDADGNRTSVTNGSGQVTAYGFNALDLMTSETDPSGHVTSYSYDASGNRVSKTNPDSSVTSWSYDANGNVATTTSGSGSGSMASFTYNPNGRVASMTDGTGTSSYTYDTNGNLISSTDGQGAMVTYGYDANANMTCMSVPNPANNGCTATGASGTGIVTYAYSNTGSLTSLHDWAGRSFSYSYDANGNQTALSINGGAVTIAKHYDANGSITDQSSTPGIQIFAAGSNLLSLSVARNADGTIASTTPTIGSTPGPTDSFGYGTPAGQRSPVVTSGPIGAASGSTSYQYSPAGSITQSANQFASAAYSASGALCWTSSAAVASPSCGAPPSGATSYTYGANGERTSMTPSTGNPSAYGWNSAPGTLACVNTNGTSCSTTSPSATTTTYAYDGNGLRTTATTGTGTTHYTWDNASSIPRLVSDGTWDYVYEPGSNVPIEQISTTGSTPTADLLITDANSAVKGLVQLSAGAQQGKLVNYVDYDAYGNPITGAGGAPAPGGLRVPQMGISATTAFGFGGGYTDPTGLIYLVHRYYDLATGQFLSVDPLLNGIQQPHVYASDDPVNSTDLGGEIVNGYCLSGSAFGVIGGTAIWCSLYDNHGGSRVTRTVEAGVGWGAGVSYGFFYSSVVRIRDLMGASWCFGGGDIGALEVCLISTRYGTQYSVFFGFAGAEFQASTTIGYTSDTTAFERWVLARMGISGR